VREAIIGPESAKVSNKHQSKAGELAPNLYSLLAQSLHKKPLYTLWETFDYDL
jgi:hypothetical protein